jgi:hypothetical protein
MTPNAVYLGALKHYFGNIVINSRDPIGKRIPVRVAYLMARCIAAHYAFHFDYSNHETLSKK